jgi:hypothetical protein
MIDCILDDKKKFKSENHYDVEEFFSQEKIGGFNFNDSSSFDKNGQEKIVGFNLSEITSFDNIDHEKMGILNLSEIPKFDNNYNENFGGALNDISSLKKNNNDNGKLGNAFDFLNKKRNEYNNIVLIDNKINEGEKNLKISISNTNNGSTKPTAIRHQKIVAKIFNIEKVNKKMGRLSKNTKIKFKNIKHDKFSQDNIIRKIKVNFHEKLLNYINEHYGNYYRKKHRVKKMVKLIQRIAPSESRKIKRDENLKWFSLKLKDVFSGNLSNKCLKYGLDYNKKQIELLYKKGEATSIINILETTIKEMYQKYCNDVKVEFFETLKDDLYEMKKKMVSEGEENIEDYLNTYKNVAKNLEDIFRCKKTRKSRKSKDKTNC